MRDELPEFCIDLIDLLNSLLIVVLKLLDLTRIGSVDVDGGKVVDRLISQTVLPCFFPRLDLVEDFLG